MLEKVAPPEIPDKRLVVLVDEDDYRFAGPLMGTLDDGLETLGISLRNFRDSILRLPPLEKGVEHIVKSAGLIIPVGIQVEVQDWIGLPVPVHRIDVKSLEEFPASFEEIT